MSDKQGENVQMVPKTAAASAKAAWDAERAALRKSNPDWTMPAWSRAPAWRRRPYLMDASTGENRT